MDARSALITPSLNEEGRNMEPLLAVAQKLCRNVTGSQCSPPRLSNWALVAPNQSSISADVADIATEGAGAIAPVNVKVYGSYMVYAKAIGLMAGVGLATSLDVEASGMVYRVGLS